MGGKNPTEILDIAFQKASGNLGESFIKDGPVAKRVNFVCRDIRNRACVRVLLAGALAKSYKPNVDIRKPYTEIQSDDAYSGRSFDETYITAFVHKHNLPCNPTTAFLTPALRNRNMTLTPDLELEGRPRELYKIMLQVLDDVYNNKVSADDLLNEIIRCLVNFKNERLQRMNEMMKGLRNSSDAMPLSAETIVKLIQQHLECKGASRLPVLVVAAAYDAARKYLGEKILPLHAHNAADDMTGALGDLEITIESDKNVITSYEMKTRKVTRDDIDRALQKVNDFGKEIDNYIFITTDEIQDDAKDYAASLYEKTYGVEFVILDCINFLRHFLHLFHRVRMEYLEAYQILVLAEPESAVRQELKEAFLALRQAAESA